MTSGPTASSISSGTARTARSPRVAIVGAGMSGIALAMRLIDAGYDDFTIFEKADELGGTWHHNRYPGVACDVPSRFYTYGSEPSSSWSSFFPPGREIWAYFDDVARRRGVRDHISFGTEVTEAEWTGSRWRLTTTAGDAGEFDVLVTATGILHQPYRPAIPGLGSFAGAVLHSAEWDDDVVLTDRRIGVVGTGSTGVQIVSALTPSARLLTVFQRTPQWLLPVPNWHYTPIGRMLGRSRRMSTIARGFYHRVFEQTFGVATARPGWQRTVMSALCRLHLRRIADPELRAKLTPDYQPMCKRIVMSATFYPAIQQPNVNLVTEPINEIVPEGVRTADGVTHPLDVLVLATGFQTRAFMRPMRIRGEDGLELDDLWRDAPFAYRTVAIPGFPNLFTLVGPHSPIGNFSLISIAEAQADYVIEWIGAIAHGEVAAVTPRADATAAYNASLQKATPRTVWASGCRSWYLDSEGRPITFPGTPSEHRALLRTVRRDDFVTVPSRGPGDEVADFTVAVTP
jgi:cation diffusion facilitator CzcD-associated flavoprotein CzcO